mgnify:FL=1
MNNLKWKLASYFLISFLVLACIFFLIPQSDGAKDVNLYVQTESSYVGFHEIQFIGHVDKLLEDSLWIWRGQYIGEIMNITDNTITITPIMFVRKDDELVGHYVWQKMTIDPFNYDYFSVFSDSVETNNVLGITTYMRFKVGE